MSINKEELERGNRLFHCTSHRCTSRDVKRPFRDTMLARRTHAPEMLLAQKGFTYQFNSNKCIRTMLKKPEDIENKWKANVEEANRILNSKRQNQLAIAQLALEVCEVEKGGARKAGHDYKFTLLQFAKEAGLHPKTLYQWVLLKRNVYDKLSEENKFKVKFSHLTYINRRVNSSTTADTVNEALVELFQSVGIDRYILRYCVELQAVAHHLRKPNFKSLVAKKTVEELVFHLETAMKLFKGHYPVIKGIDHKNAARYSNRKSTGPTLIGNMQTQSGIWIHMKDKDENIYRYLRQRHKAWTTPTVIGEFVRKQMGRTFKNPTPFACRSLRKLETLGLAERDEKGRWRAINKDIIQK